MPIADYEFPEILFGAAYYNEYHQGERLAEDFALMREAGVNVIRVGESVWAKWQPTETTFDLDWLQPILDEAHRSGIRVIVGTPTYAVPRWIFINYPEVVAQKHSGAPIPYGHRQNVDYSHPTFLRLAEVIIRKIVNRYQDHPAIIGWQVDNEPGAEVLHNPNVFEGFKASLQSEFGDVENLNKAWGLTYWAQSLTSWDQLWLPDGNTNPSYFLAWRKYNAKVTNDFLDWQRHLIRSMVKPSQFITTCVAPNRPGVDTNTIGQVLDLTAVNVYYASQDGLKHPTHQRQPGEESPAPIWVPLYGASNLNMQADIARGFRQENFLVTETNAGAIAQGMAVGSFPPYPGQMKQAALAMVSRGAQMIEYWHWHSLPYGTENFWGGLLPHSLEPARIFTHFKETASTLKQVSKLGNLKPEGDVALVISTEARWAFQLQGPLRNPITLPDADGYDKTLLNVYDACYTAGLSVEIYGENQVPTTGSAAEFAAKHPVMILHSLFFASDQLLEFADAYAAAGGHLVLTPRTGYSHPNYVLRTQVMPGALRAAVGGSYTEFSNLTKPAAAVTVDGRRVGNGYAWIDAIEVDTAQAVVRLEHPFYGKFAALSNHKYGSGQVSYLATYPDYEFSQYLGEYLSDSVASRPKALADLASVVTNRAKTADGIEVFFVFNWSFDTANARFELPVVDVETGEHLAVNESFELSAWSVRIFTLGLQRKLLVSVAGSL